VEEEEALRCGDAAAGDGDAVFVVAIAVAAAAAAAGSFAACCGLRGGYRATTSASVGLPLDQEEEEGAAGACSFGDKRAEGALVSSVAEAAAASLLAAAAAAPLSFAFSVFPPAREGHAPLLPPSALSARGGGGGRGGSAAAVVAADIACRGVECPRCCCCCCCCCLGCSCCRCCC